MTPLIWTAKKGYTKCMEQASRAGVSKFCLHVVVHAYYGGASE